MSSKQAIEAEARGCATSYLNGTGRRAEVLHWRVVCLAWLLCSVGTVGTAAAADWRQFRGPGGQGISSEKGLPTEWSSHKNIRWKTPLVGPGTSSPVTVGDRIYLTCYTGYALDAQAPGKMEDLRRHLVCLALGDGKILWTKQFDPKLPEHVYAGEGSYHGYSSSTPTSDGERLFVFFGKSGVYCFDLAGNEIWHTSVGDGIDRWGSATSPVLFQNLVIINASVESGAIVALDKATGKEVWRAPGIKSAWNTPILVQTEPHGVELVVAVRDRIVSLNPETGKELWNAEGIHRYVCPSLVDHDGVVYAIGGGRTSLAVRAGGHGDVTKTHVLWRVNKGSNVPSPIYADGHLFWASEKGAAALSERRDREVRVQPPHFARSGPDLRLPAACRRQAVLRFPAQRDLRAGGRAEVQVARPQYF